MGGVDMDKWWANFTASPAATEVEQWVWSEIERTRPVFDYQDGTHAKWVDGTNLGVLVTFELDELAKLLLAWEEANEEHNEFAADFIMGWVGALMRMLELAAESPMET